jgi:hypothetical protein
MPSTEISLTLTRGQSLAYHGKYGVPASDRVTKRVREICASLFEQNKTPVAVYDTNGDRLFTYVPI